MKQLFSVLLVALLVLSLLSAPAANGYLLGSTIPSAGGCPAFHRWNLSLSAPLNRRWSTSLPVGPSSILTVASSGTNQQLSEIEQAISDSFDAWSGVTGTTVTAATHPGLIAPMARVSAANACSNDQDSNVDGLNTICFNQASAGFSSGVLAFTRVITANAPGVSIGAGAPAAFAGQILDADTLFRGDGQATFATPTALASQQGQGAYDLESLLAHELGHWFGIEHSAVWRALMFPFAPPPGQFLGDRPSALQPDAILSDDDRTGIRALYSDPGDAVNVGSIRGRVLPANAFSLATVPSPSPGQYVTGIFGAHVVAVDADTGAVVAGTFAGWSCDPLSPVIHFDGSFDLERLPVSRSYLLYAEPLAGLAAPADFSEGLGDLCASAAPTCVTPAVQTNFNPRTRPNGP